jgi:hypothetical protein
MLFAATPANTQTAEITFSITPKEAEVGKEVAVQFFLDTKQRSVNALSAEVTISDGGTVSRIRDGDSIIGAWLKKATTEDPTHVSFSGIIPGGVITAQGKILTLYIIPRQPGVFKLSVTGSTFENGALAIAAPLRLSATSVKAVPVLPTSETPSMVVEDDGDMTPPQEVTANIYQNEEMFGGNFFVIMHAKDSESGVATFELLETPERHPVDVLRGDRTLAWRVVDNPAPLHGAAGSGFIYLRVTDRDGNAAVIEVGHPIQLSPESTKWLFNKWFISAILIVVAGFVFLRLRRRLRA